MTQLTCPGLPADWINGWLAAVGATVLDTRLRLHWTTDGAPLAVLSAAEIDPVDALCESWPDMAQLSDMPIAEKWKGAGELRRRFRWRRSLREHERCAVTRVPGRCRRR